MRMNNKGLSLVELIVVITILVVLSSVGVIGVGLISGKPAQQCVEKMKTALTNDRTTAMGKFDAVAYLYEDSDGSIYLEEQIYNTMSDISSKRYLLGPSSVDVYYSIDGSDPTTPLPVVDGGGSGFEVSFNRSTGGLKNYTNPVWIKATKAGKSYYVHIYSITGKIEVLNSFTSD